MLIKIKKIPRIDYLPNNATNFLQGSLVKKLELPSTSLKARRTRARERVVDIWKVHGSLDWFIAPDGTLASLPFSRTIPIIVKVENDEKLRGLQVNHLISIQSSIIVFLAKDSTI